MNSTELLAAADNDFRMLKEKGKEGEEVLHLNGFLDGSAYGFCRSKEYHIRRAADWLRANLEDGDALAHRLVRDLAKPGGNPVKRIFALIRSDNGHPFGLTVSGDIEALRDTIRKEFEKDASRIVCDGGLISRQELREGRAALAWDSSNRNWDIIEVV